MISTKCHGDKLFSSYKILSWITKSTQNELTNDKYERTYIE